MSLATDYTVRAAHCDYRASQKEIYDNLCRITEPLERSWKKLQRARKIVIKANMVWPPERITYFKGRRRELVDDAVFRAVLRLLRERTTGKLIVTDTSFRLDTGTPGTDVNMINILDEFGVEYVESNTPPFEIFDVPGGGLMFSRYQLSACFADADAVVSVAKMKTHAFMGITLCLKNLFGLPPLPPHGRPRSYFHHIIRLSYVLPDLGLVTKPCLNIIDGLTGQSRREWGGEGRICNTLIAGDHVIATDACASWLMGHDPASDWPTPPFKRDQNALLVAAENGFGTVNLDEIDFQTEVQPPVAEFDSDELDTNEMVTSWRRTTCEQALFYRDNPKDIFDNYTGEYVFLQDNKVVWHGSAPGDLGSRRMLSGERKESALWLKFVDQNDPEGEHFGVYEDILKKLSKS